MALETQQVNVQELQRLNEAIVLVIDAMRRVAPQLGQVQSVLAQLGHLPSQVAPQVAQSQLPSWGYGVAQWPMIQAAPIYAQQAAPMYAQQPAPIFAAQQGAPIFAQQPAPIFAQQPAPIFAQQPAPFFTPQQAIFTQLPQTPYVNLTQRPF